MAWLSKRSKAEFYGLEYEHPKDDYYDFIFVRDYIFTSESYEGVSILENIINCLYNAGCDSLSWSDFTERLNGDGEIEYFLSFCCDDRTYQKIDYTMDAWTDGWGYWFEKLD